MTVEMDDRNWSVRAINRPQQRQSDSMIATHGNNTGKRLAFLRRSELVCVSGWITRENAVMAFLDLVESPCVVVPAASSLMARPKRQAVGVSTRTR